MTEQNVEVVRQVFEAAGRGDYEGVFALFDAGIEWDMSRLMPDSRVYHGHDGVREYWRSWAGTWEDFDAAIEQAIDAGDDEVVIRIHNAARGRSSGAPVEFHFGQVWTVSNGKVVRLRAFPTFDDALEAVGLLA